MAELITGLIWIRARALASAIMSMVMFFSSAFLDLDFKFIGWNSKEKC
jgi:hypothetical protein